MNSVCRFAIATVAFSCALVLPQLSAADSGYDRPTGYHRTVVWQSDQATARGLFFFQSGAPGLIRRVLIETPDGRHLVLTKALLPRQGLDREVLLDEETGWQVELTKRFPFRAESLDVYLKRMLDWAGPREGEEIAFTLVTNAGISFSASVPVMGQPATEHDRFATLLTGERNAVERLNIPETLRPSIRFLDQAFETEISDSRGIIDVLSATLGEAPTHGASPWRQVDGSTINGLIVGDGEHIEFASDFPSVNPVTPLPEGRLEELAQSHPR